jgi:hypothetical protein
MFRWQHTVCFPKPLLDFVFLSQRGFAAGDNDPIPRNTVVPKKINIE